MRPRPLERRNISSVQIKDMNVLINKVSDGSLTLLERQVVKVLIHEVATLRQKGVRNDGAWTKRIFEALADNAYAELSAEACYPGGRARGHNGGWLADFVLYCNDLKGNFLRLLLVAESEWRQEIGALIYDFEKLLVLRADHRLFLFQAVSGRQIENDLTDLVECAAHHELLIPGDRCLFAAYDRSSGGLEFHLWVHQEGVCHITPSDSIAESTS